MVWTNPPASLTAFRSMLVACASAVTSGLTSGQVHYPSASYGAEAGTPETLPYAILSETEHSRKTYAAGAGGLPSGKIQCTLYFAESNTTGTIETLCRNLCSELLAQTTGLPITDASASLASEPTPESRASTAVIMANLEITWGIQ